MTGYTNGGGLGRQADDLRNQYRNGRRLPANIHEFSLNDGRRFYLYPDGAWRDEQGRGVDLGKLFPPPDSISPLRVRDFHEIDFDPTTEEWLIEDLLFPEEISLITGPPNCGKTFLALDLNLAVADARGGEWQGHKVTPGPVVYLACEGGKRIDKRIAAWKQAHGYKRGDRLPFAVISEPVDLCNMAAGDCQRIIDTINSHLAGAPLALLTIETVNTVMNGGNENAPEDMGRFLGNVRRLRDELGCHVLLIHHPSRNGAGARGHSSLPALVDTELAVSHDPLSKTSTIRMNKQREAEKAEPIGFALKVVELGHNRDGKVVTSCVVEPAEPVLKAKGAGGLGPAAARGLEMLHEAINTAGETPPASTHIPRNTRCVKIDLWRRYCYQGGIADGNEAAKRQAFKRGRDFLLGGHHIAIWGEWVWPT